MPVSRQFCDETAMIFMKIYNRKRCLERLWEIRASQESFFGDIQHDPNRKNDVSIYKLVKKCRQNQSKCRISLNKDITKDRNLLNAFLNLEY